MVSSERTIDTQLLRAFVATARYNGVTAAADALAMAKSAVSKQLVTLERLLDLRLFERGGRKIILTREGQLLLARAESILAELDQFVVDAQDQATHVRGTVRVAASPEFGALLAKHFIPRVLARHPALNIAMTSEYQFDDLHDPDVDLAFRLGTVSDDRLIARPLGDFACVLACAPAYARSRTIKVPEDLAQANVLLFSDRELTASWTFRGESKPHPQRDVEVRGTFGVLGFEALAVAAVAGLGIARLPSFVATPRVTSGSLVRLLPKWRLAPVQVHLAYREGISRVARVRAVIDAAQADIPTLLASMGC
jgi:DNA-binding transcriptional LysR family regulator